VEEQRLERIEQKLDKIDEKVSKVCSEIRLHEYRISRLEKQNNNQEEELKPLSNTRWLIIQIPSVVAVITSLIAILKVFGRVP